jgi:galactokinase
MQYPAPFDLAAFKSALPGPKLVCRAPGRINLIGEHTDYNDGFVLPAAIENAVYVAVSKRSDDCISLYANAYGQGVEKPLSHIRPSKQAWYNYPAGAAALLQKAGYNLGGFHAVIDGNVPLGAGLSSSAALTSAVIFALDALFELNIDRNQMALLAQQVEHQFAGVQCGIMDMYASLFGNKNSVIQLDCRHISHSYISMELGDYALLLLNTNVKHSLASSAYNQRRQECEAGVGLVQQMYPEVKALRDVTLPMLQQCVSNEAVIYQRCKYVIEENNRLLLGCQDLAAGRFDAFGQKMLASHEGLKTQYEVSCAELDVLVEVASKHPMVLGARMMGGGFGGCTINLVHKDGLDDFIAAANAAYHRHFGILPTVIPVNVDDGVRLV